MKKIISNKGSAVVRTIKAKCILSIDETRINTRKYAHSVTTALGNMKK